MNWASRSNPKVQICPLAVPNTHTHFQVSTKHILHTTRSLKSQHDIYDDLRLATQPRCYIRSVTVHILHNLLMRSHNTWLWVLICWSGVVCGQWSLWRTINSKDIRPYPIYHTNTIRYKNTEWRSTVRRTIALSVCI